MYQHDWVTDYGQISVENILNSEPTRTRESSMIPVPVHSSVPVLVELELLGKTDF